MYLVLDTNILHQESLTSANMKSLLRVVQSQFVTICVPSLVRREYLTKVVHDSSANFQAASGKLDNVMKTIKISEGHADLTALLANLAELKARIARTYERDFDTWAATYRIRTVEFEPTQINSVMDDYFSGAAPFKGLKSREDIVDAMIGKCIDSLVAEVGAVGVVLKDGAFRKHLEQQGRVQIFDGLADVLESPPIKNEMARLDREGDIPAFMAALSGAGTRAALAEIMGSNQQLLDSIYLEENEIAGIDNLEIRCFGVRINGPLAREVASIQLGQLDYVGHAQFAFAFEMKANIRADFCANYGDYLELSNEREANVCLASMNNIGMCDLEEDRTAIISGKLTVDIGAGTTIEGLNQLLLAGRPGLATFLLEIEARSAVLLPSKLAS